MWEFFTDLFSTKFMPHGHCFFWRPEILWLHVVSDLIVAMAYYSIPILLFIVARRSPRLPFKWVFICFALFIFWCGTTHVLSIVTLWVPIYRLEGLIKAITAAISLATALLLFAILPRILHPKSLLSSSSENLEKKND